MKIQCDVCEKQEAAVFCAADEAALCEGCDHRVHHANKLASKHQRFSLLHPSFKDAPLCDICQERRAFLFCREDRAILCRECDIPIHKANEHTQNHHRFLLTGVKLSSSSSLYPNSSALSTSSSEPNSTNSNSATNSSYDYYYTNNDSNMDRATSSATTNMETNYNQQFNEDCSMSNNNGNFEDYFMETMPGWRLEDLLHSSSVPHCKTFDYYKNNNATQVNPNEEQVAGESMGSFSSTGGYSSLWGFHHQEPLVPSHFPPIFSHKPSS